MPNYVKNLVSFKGTKEDLEKMIAFLKQGDRKELDFNLLIPEPEDLTTADSPSDETGVAIGEYLVDGTFESLQLKTFRYSSVKAEMESTLNRTFETDKELVKAYMAHLLEKPYLEDTYWKRCIRWYSNLKKYGYTDWYSWRVDNWGTKWNACEPDSLDILNPVKDATNDTYYYMEYRFDTAWSMPDGIYKALSKMFPKVTIDVEYADEDLGQNCGNVIYENGEVSKETIYNGSTKEAYEFAIALWEDYDLLNYLKQDENGNWYIDMDAYYEGGEA